QRRRMVVWRSREVSLGRQLPHRIQPRQPEVLHREHRRSDLQAAARSRVRVLSRELLRAERAAEVLPRQGIPDRHSVQLAGDRDADEVLDDDSWRSDDRAQRGALDDRSDAGCERLLLLPQVSGDGRPDPDASLGSGDDVSGARPAAAAARGAGREHSVNTVRTDGHLIVNADDWGRDQPTTDCTFHCVKKGAVAAVSAMVFMEDSERAAAIAREHSVDAGLHLNFTSPFTSSQCPPRLDQQQRRITSYLKAHRMAQLVFNPMLTRAFDDVVRAQV